MASPDGQPIGRPEWLGAQMTARRAEARATGAATRGGCHCGHTAPAGKAALLQLGRKQTYWFSTSESGRREILAWTSQMWAISFRSPGGRGRRPPTRSKGEADPPPGLNARRKGGVRERTQMGWSHI
eukprot:2811562-Pyramimonas_sp.AAC.1